MNLSGLRDAIHHRMQEKESRQSRRTEILNTVERVVEGTDSRIRLVNNYNKKLQQAVVCSLEYTDDLIEQIPAAIEIVAALYKDGIIEKPDVMPEAASVGIEIERIQGQF